MTEEMTIVYFCIGYIFTSIFVIPPLLYLGGCIDIVDWEIKFIKRTFQEAVNPNGEHEYIIVCLFWLPFILILSIGFLGYFLCLQIKKFIIDPFFNFVDTIMTRLDGFTIKHKGNGNNDE